MMMMMMMMTTKTLLTLMHAASSLQHSSRLAAGSSSGRLSSTSNSHSSSWSASLADQASQLAEQLQRGNTINKITAARRLQRLASSKSQVCIPGRLEDMTLTCSHSIQDNAPNTPVGVRPGSSPPSHVDKPFCGWKRCQAALGIWNSID